VDVAPTYAVTSPELVHLAILKDAAEIASVEAVNDARLPEIVGGAVFSATPLRSRRGGLALSLTRGMERLPAEKRTILNEIAVRAVKRSILKNQREFVGLIIGHARQGANYFDRFKYQVGDQMELF
jgi:hypothetical protein